MATAGLALLLWTVLARRLDSLLLPEPLAVLKQLLILIRTGGLLADIGWTLLRVALGVAAGFIAGLALGTLLARSAWAYHFLDPLLQFLRPISPFAWTPLVILLFGLGNPPAVITIFIGVVFPALVIVHDALKTIDRDLLDIASVFGARGWLRLCSVDLPLIFPALLSALRVLFGVGWIMAIGAEMLAANSGLGFRLMNARYLLDFVSLYALILVIGIIGWGLDYTLRRLLRRRY